MRYLPLFLALFTVGGCALFAGCSPDERLPGVAPGGGAPLANLGGDSGETGSDGQDISEALGGAGGALPLSTIDGVCAGIQCGPTEACVDEGGFALCKCRSGFSGPDCEDINECENAERCGSDGTCVNRIGTYSCECDLGFSDVDGQCENVDECADGVHACDEYAACLDAEGTHLCTCEPGRYGDGTFCKLEDSCAGSPCGAGSCTNTPDGFSCACPLGTSGSQCQDTCPLDAPIAFESDVLEAAIRQTTGITGAITPAALAPFSSLAAPPPDSDEQTQDVIDSLDGLQCWPTLTSLDLKGHTTTQLGALSSLGALRTLDLQCTQASDLSALAGLAELRELNVSKSSICGTTQRSPGFLEFSSGLTRLESLAANGWAYVGDLTPLAGLARLDSLELRANEIEDLAGLESLSQLRSLSLSGNPLESLLPLSGLPLLTKLDLAFSGLDDIAALAGTKTLQQLDLSYNQLEDLAPLSGLASLRLLYLGSNNISKLSPIVGLEELVILDVSNNVIIDLSPLSQNADFDVGQLDLVENSFECEDVQSDFAALWERGVSIYSDCE